MPELFCLKHRPQVSFVVTGLLNFVFVIFCKQRSNQREASPRLRQWSQWFFLGALLIIFAAIAALEKKDGEGERNWVAAAIAIINIKHPNCAFPSMLSRSNVRALILKESKIFCS